GLKQRGSCEWHMFSVSFDRVHKVLRLDFSGLFTTEDLDAIDPLLIRFLGGEDRFREQIRILYDATAIQALAVPQRRFAQRAAKAAIGNVMRVIAAPSWATLANFGSSYRAAQSIWPHSQPVIVPTLPDAFRLLSLVHPQFDVLDSAPVKTLSVSVEAKPRI